MENLRLSGCLGRGNGLEELAAGALRIKVFDALLAVCERLAEGRGPSLKDRVVAALNQLRNRISR